MDEQPDLVPEWPNVHVDVEGSWFVWTVLVCGPGFRSGPGRPAAWRPASSSAGLVPTGGPPARSSERVLPVAVMLPGC